MVQYEIKVNGRVQGVGFRYYTKKQADMLGIKGWVKNTFDGSVLLIAQGTETDIDTFLDYLKVGPSLSKVERVTSSKMNFAKKFEGFEVRF